MVEEWNMGVADIERIAQLLVLAEDIRLEANSGDLSRLFNYWNILESILDNLLPLLKKKEKDKGDEIINKLNDIKINLNRAAKLASIGHPSMLRVGTGLKELKETHRNILILKQKVLKLGIPRRKVLTPEQITTKAMG